MASKVSVIMPVYKGEKHLATAIDSVLTQTYGDFELIVVNDCSPDRSEEIIRRYAGDPRVKVLRNATNLGVAASRNRALVEAAGQYVTFLDQDDIWVPEKIAIQVSVIEAHPELGLLYSRIARMDDAGVLCATDAKRPPTDFGNPNAKLDIFPDVFPSLFISNSIQPLTTMIPRRVLDDVGPFIPELAGADDYELWLRIALRYPVGRLETILGFWRSHPRQQSNLGFKMLMLRLKSLDLILSRFPDSRRRVPRKAFSDRMHSLCEEAADHTMYFLHDYPEARRLFVRAIGYHPLDLASWMKAAYCAMPAALRERLKGLNSKLKGAFR